MGRTTLKQIEELRQRWKFNEALGELAGYLKRRPKSKRALELMVDIHHDLNDDSAAYEIVDILTELYPNNAGYWGAKTWYAREKGGADLLIKTVNDFIPIAEEGKKISPEKIYNNYQRLCLRHNCVL